MTLRNDSALEKEINMKTHTYVSVYSHSHSLLLIVKLSGEMGQTNTSTRHSGIGFFFGGGRGVLSVAHHQCNVHSDDIFIFEALLTYPKF